MRIFSGDVLDFNMEPIFPSELSTHWSDKQPHLHIIGNLPFNVSTPLIVRWLEDMSMHRGAWKHGRVPLTLTFQKEVAERIVAPVLTEQRCRLSVMCQYLCDVKHHFTIGGRSFVPPPEVDVGIVRFVPLAEPRIQAPFHLVEKLLRHVFQFRQKMCKNGLQYVLCILNIARLLSVFQYMLGAVVIMIRILYLCSRSLVGLRTIFLHVTTFGQVVHTHVPLSRSGIT